MTSTGISRLGMVGRRESGKERKPLTILCKSSNTYGAEIYMRLKEENPDYRYAYTQEGKMNE